MKTDLGQRIRKARHLRGLTLEQLARMTETDKGYLSRIENGKMEPTLKRLRSIAKHLDIPPSRLIA
jgi:transcriptional regulator with XRE-family HTH domain